MKIKKALLINLWPFVLMISSLGYSYDNPFDSPEDDSNNYAEGSLVNRLHELKSESKSDDSDDVDEVNHPKGTKKSKRMKKRLAKVKNKLVKKIRGRKKAEQINPHDMDDFYLAVDSIMSSFKSIDKTTQEIRGLEVELKAAFDSDKEAKVLSKLEKLRDQTNLLLKKTKANLDKMKSDTDEYKNGADPNIPNLGENIRIRETIFGSLVKKFGMETTEYQKSQLSIKESLDDKARRQVLSIAPELNDEELESIKNDREARAQILEAYISGGNINSEIKLTYVKASEKYNAVKKLEKNVTELHQMFLDLALLAQIQGEQLDNIEYNVKCAASDIEAANIDIYEAIKSAKNSHRNGFITTVLTAAAVTVLVVVLV
ncbi:MAG: hypothetical protein HRU09_16720 [Oligoflexales bacterium]|nr:hypothetical protein [Oligoflexales bacterium]